MNESIEPNIKTTDKKTRRDGYEDGITTSIFDLGKLGRIPFIGTMKSGFRC